MNALQKIKNLTKQLFPTGRAFKMPLNGESQKLADGLAVSEEQAYQDAVSLYNSMFPDNDAFTTSDAAEWERRFGMITNTSVPLVDRKLAIARRMSISKILPRQSYLYLQNQLRAAGFDVYVHENKVPTPKLPIDVVRAALGTIEHGEKQHGEFEHGDYGESNIGLIANHIDESRDAYFVVGPSLRSTFFIGGSPIGTFADIDEERKNEFRQLVLRIKPAQAIAYLFINYI